MTFPTFFNPAGFLIYQKESKNSEPECASIWREGGGYGWGPGGGTVPLVGMGLFMLVEGGGGEQWIGRLAGVGSGRGYHARQDDAPDVPLAAVQSPECLLRLAVCGEREHGWGFLHKDKASLRYPYLQS